jgi:hypothetical protein
VLGRPDCEAAGFTDGFSLQLVTVRKASVAMAVAEQILVTRVRAILGTLVSFMTASLEQPWSVTGECRAPVPVVLRL